MDEDRIREVVRATLEVLCSVSAIPDHYAEDPEGIIEKLVLEELGV